MEQYTYKFCPDFGIPCKKPIVEIISGTGYEQECEQEGCIEIVLDPDAQDRCIQVLIFCEDCGSCPPIIKDICFCDNELCGPCQKCNSLGICEDLCKPNEFCEDDKCVECNPDVPCPGNKICVNGKCVCPQGTFFHPPLNKCVECIPGEVIDKCRTCNEQGEIVTIPCAGDCDPLEGCVDCLKDSSCSSNTDGRTCCDPTTKKCVCCPGFIWDPILKKCGVKPPCEPGSCGPCKKCDPILGCIPVICPDGFVCDPILDDCVYTPCPPTPCKDGTDCGKECGCKDVTCTECAKLSCQDCNKALGCKCNPQTGKCEKVTDCNNPCITKHDCDTNCGCDDATCKDCANYSCEECGKIPGCKCNPQTNKCEGDGTRGDDNCKDTFKVEKGPSCEDPKLIATLTKDTPCNCEPFNFEVKDFASGGKLVVKKVKGDGLVSFSDTLSPFISDKEKEVEGTVKVVIKGSYNTTDNLGTNIAFEQSITLPVNDTSGEINLKNFIPLQATNFNKLTAASITITNESLKVKENNCTYGKEVIYTNSVLTNFNYSNGTVIFTPSATDKSDTKITSTTKRQPLFVWYEDLNNIVKREYVNGTTTFVSELKPDLYKTKKSYKVTNDCSCVKDALYIWDCEKEKYFEKADINFEIADCGKTFKLLSVTKPCNPLHLLEKYNLYVNGELIVNIVEKDLPLPITKKYNNPVESVYIIVEGTECRKDYDVEKYEEVKPDIKSDCNLATAKTSHKIQVNTIDSTTTVTSVKYNIFNLGDDINNPGFKFNNILQAVNGTYTVDSNEDVAFLVTYSNGCSQRFILVPKANCCEKCNNGDDDISTVIFLKSGEEGEIEVMHSCDITPITFQTDSSFIKGFATSGNKTTVAFVTPNSSGVQSFIANYNGLCTKTFLIDFIKSELYLELDKETGCSDPTLTVKSTGTSQISFEVKSSCNPSFVWSDIYTGNNTKPVSQNFGTCKYYISKISGIEIANPIELSYTKININNTVLDILQEEDACNSTIKFKVISNQPINLNGYNISYTVDGTLPEKTATIFIENNQNIFNIERSNLINDETCISKEIKVTKIKQDSCEINYDRLIPNQIKCIFNPTYEVKCTTQGSKELLITVPDNVLSLTAIVNNGEPFSINTVKGISPRILSYVYTNNINTIRITPDSFNNIQHCTKEILLSSINCDKATTTITGDIEGCQNSGTYTPSENKNMVTIYPVFDQVNFVNQLQTDGDISTFNSNTNKRYYISIIENGIEKPAIGMIFQSLPGNKISVKIPTINNYVPNTKIRVVVKEDNQRTGLSKIIDLVNKSGNFNFQNYTIVTNPQNGIPIFTPVSGSPAGTTITPNSTVPAFAIISSSTTDFKITHYDINNVIIGQQSFLSSVNTVQSTLNNPSSLIDFYVNVPFGSSYAILENVSDCPSNTKITYNINWSDPLENIAQYISCTGTLTVFVNEYYPEHAGIYPAGIKIGNICYSLNALIPFTGQISIDNSSINYYSQDLGICTTPICTQSGNADEYKNCDGSNDFVYLPKDTNQSGLFNFKYDERCYSYNQTTYTSQPLLNPSSVQFMPNCQICEITRITDFCGILTFDSQGNYYFIQNTNADCPDGGSCQAIDGNGPVNGFRCSQL